MRTVGTAAISILIFLVIASGSATGQVNGSGLILFRTVALTGQQAPGADPGSVFSSLSARGIDAQGRVLVRGKLSGPSADKDTGMWLGSAAGLIPVAMESAPAADIGSSIVYGDFYSLGCRDLTPDGSISFSNQVAGPGVSSTNDDTRFAGRVGALRMMARESGRVPTLSPDITYRTLGAPLPVNNGCTSFHGYFWGPGVTTATDSALFAGPLDNLRVLVREGSQAAGTPIGAKYSLFSMNSEVPSPPVNAAGDYVFFASLTGAGVTGGNDRGLWVGDIDGQTLLARKGSRPPGMPAGVLYYNMARPMINNAGQVAFFSIMSGTGITSSNDDAIWVGTPGNLRLLARAGDPAPGTNTTFERLESRTSLNGNGQVAFLGWLAGGIPGFWVGTPGDLHKVVATGDSMPDGSGTFRLQYIRLPLMLNGQGQLAFLNAYYGGPGSLWATDPAGQLRLVCRNGDPFQIAPGDTRVISSIGSDGDYGNQTGYASYFNDAGELLVSLTFTDGSEGIFVATILEPLLSVEIDIKPDSDTNPINLGSRGLIPVAILTTADFDAATVDPATVRLAEASVATRGNGKQLLANEQDVDNDGDLDLVLHFETQELVLLPDATAAVLTGQTYDGMEIEGSDSIVIVPK